MRKPLLLSGKLLLLLLLSATSFACWRVAAQQTQDTQELQRVESPPPFGTFYSARTGIPYPFDLSFGQLAVYQWKPGVYIVDDSQSDGAQAQMSAGGGGMMTMDAAPAPCEGNCPTNSEGGGPVSFGPPAYSYDSTNLWLEITGITNNQAFFVIKTPDPSGPYDFFSTTNLAATTNAGNLNRTNWVWLTRTAFGQTNITLTNLWPSEGWFQLGTMADDDSDGLPDAFESLVSHTSVTNSDSNANGTRDGDEMGPNGLPWRLEFARRNAAVVYANATTATEGGSCGQFTVYLPTPAPSGGTVKYRFEGSSTVGTDFTVTPSGNTLTFSAGATSAVITVCAFNDNSFSDLDRYVEITLTNSSFCAVDSQPARINIVDNDLPAVRVFAFPQWVRKPSQTFGTNAAGFFFVRDGESVNAVDLYFSLAGSAVSGTDYNALSSPINFPAGVRTNYLPVTLKPTTNTADKTLTLNISSASGYQLDPAANSATITIASSSISVPVVQVTATDDDARESGLMPGKFTFTRTGTTTNTLRAFYHVSGTAQAGSTNSARDYVELPGYVDFPVGSNSMAVVVSPLDDEILETVETVIVTIAGGDYSIGTSNRAIVYIDDKNPAQYDPVITRDGVHGANYSAPLYMRVTRYGTALSSASMTWAITYTFGNTTLTGSSIGGDISGSQIFWPARQSVANVYFSTTWSSQLDQTYNATLKLNGGTWQFNAQYHPQSHLVRVTSSGSPATIVQEGTTASTALSFSRPYPSSSSVTAFYSVQGSAVAPGDYTALSGQVFFPANSAGPTNVAVTAAVNSQTNGWRTALVTFDSGTGFVGDAPYEHAYFRIQDVQVSNPTPDTDIDSDGLSDGWELSNGTDPITADDSKTDADRDGLALFQEIQLGTNPNVADAQPVYPSEDPDDYVPLTLRLGATGKLADQVGCAVCHSVGLRAGSHSRNTPRTSWQNPNNTQEHLIRFLRGTNYAVRLMDDPYSKVLSSGQTNSTVHKYTAAYTAQFLAASNAAYTLVSDTNQLFGTNRAMITEALARNATLFVPDLLIAADADRDGIVSTSNRIDRTSPNTPFVFWTNDDVDHGDSNNAEDWDPSAPTNTINSANSIIDNVRDLEDFTQLHFRVEGLPGNLLTNVGVQTRIYLTNLSGTPSIRLFRTAEANGGGAYLTNYTTAFDQIAKTAIGVVTNGTALTLVGTNWFSAGSNRFFLPTIFEGISTGRCVVVFAIATNNGPDVAFSRPFYLELRRVTELYEHWTVGDTTSLNYDQIPNVATNTTDSAIFGPPQNDAELDYILFVHGWRMQPWERRSFASTSFKRLWHLHYRGRFGLFSWPTDWTTTSLWDFTTQANRQNYDRSERRGWRSAFGLQLLLIDLNKRYPDRVRLMAHSMGNVVASEALLLRGLGPIRRPVVHTFVAAQAASVAHGYDAVNPRTTQNNINTDGPEVYARNPFTKMPYYVGMTNAVRFDTLAGRRNIWNFNNKDDYALNKWLVNQDLKPDNGWQFNPFNRTWRRTALNPEGEAILEFPADTYEIYAHIAEARSFALGAAEENGFTVRGQIAAQVNLNAAPFSYGANDYEHSAEFNGVAMIRFTYWAELLNRFGISP